MENSIRVRNFIFPYFQSFNETLYRNVPSLTNLFIVPGIPGHIINVMNCFFHSENVGTHTILIEENGEKLLHFNANSVNNFNLNFGIIPLRTRQRGAGLFFRSENVAGFYSVMIKGFYSLY